MKWIEIKYPGQLEELQKAFNVNMGSIPGYWFEELYEKLKQQLSTLKETL